MAIRLPVLEHQSAEDQRRAYVQSHKELTRKLADAIKAICDKHRVQYEEYLTQIELKGLRAFLANRLPNDTAKSYYTRMYVREDMNYREKSQAMGTVAESAHFIYELTDHPRPDDASAYEYNKWEFDKDRPAFAINERLDAEKIVRRRVKAYVDGIIQTFIFKVEDKLADVIVHYREYNCQLEHGAFRGGTFEGDVTVQFANGVNFRLHVMLKTNYSIYGRPYSQYPLTFHNVVRSAGEDPVAMCSEGEILDTMGIIPWKPVKQKKPWATLAVGDIVAKKDGSIRMVVGSRAPDIKLWHPDHGEETVQAKHIGVIHARTKSSYSWTHDPGSNVCQYYVYVEMHNGRCDRIYAPEADWRRIQAAETKRDDTIRRAVFPLILAKWAALVVPPEPVTKKPRRRRV